MSTPVTDPMRYNRYDETDRIEEAIAAGKHRRLIGGLWEPLGNLQRDFLRQRGLAPHHNVLDIGCGCLRAGVKLIPYLEPGRYYGIDAEPRLLALGVEHELTKAGLRDRLPRHNLCCSALFRHAHLAPATIDVGMAISVMTHLPLNFLRLCLLNAATYFKAGARLYVSFFELPSDASFAEEYRNPQGNRTFGHQDPYHYWREDMVYMAQGTSWRPSYIGDWGHPRGQMMMAYERV